MEQIKLRYLKYLCVTLFLLFTLKVTAPDRKVIYIIRAEPVDAYERLIKAVVQVESGGDTLAYNLIEEATGAFQIRPIRLQDYNLRTGNKYKIEDCYNYDISIEIFLYYANLLGIPHYETIARNWNGSGKATIDYWEKVKFYF